MAHAVFASGVMMNLADGLHLFSPLDGLGVVEDQQAIFTAFFIQPLQHRQCGCLNQCHLIKGTAPEELAVIGPMRTASQQVHQTLNGAAMTDAHRHDQRTIISINVSRNRVLDRLEKKFDFLRNFADSNHTASVLISIAQHNTYRHSRLFVFNLNYHQNSFNRSVVTLFLFAIVFSTQAAIVFDGDVSPADPGDWPAAIGTRIGSTADGCVTIDDSSGLFCYANNNFHHMAFDYRTVGTVNIHGAGSRWSSDNSTSLNIGYEGKAGANFTGGGLLYQEGDIYLARDTYGTVLSVGVANVLGGSKLETDAQLYVGYHGIGQLNAVGGSRIECTSGYIGSRENGAGLVNIHGTGTKWTCLEDLTIADSVNGDVDGYAILNITDGGVVDVYGNCYIASYIVKPAFVTINGSGSMLKSRAITGMGQYIYIGTRGDGKLAVTNGGTLDSKGSCNLAYQDNEYVVHVDGPDSNWLHNGNLTIGYFANATGDLNISNQATVDITGNVHVKSADSRIRCQVTGDNILEITGNLTNDAEILLLAGPKLFSGDYTPISVTGSWSGSGTYKPIGGTWDGATHTFSVSDPVAIPAGMNITLDLQNDQQLYISDDKGMIGVRFMGADVSTPIDFSASRTSSATQQQLRPLLKTSESVLVSWDFTTTLAAYPATVSYTILSGHDADELKIWQHDGANWSRVIPDFISYNDFSVTFTVDSFSSYAVTAPLAGMDAINPKDWQIDTGDSYGGKSEMADTQMHYWTEVPIAAEADDASDQQIYYYSGYVPASGAYALRCEVNLTKDTVLPYNPTWDIVAQYGLGVIGSGLVLDGADPNEDFPEITALTVYESGDVGGVTFEPGDTLLVWEDESGDNLQNIGDVKTLSLEIDWDGSSTVDYCWRENDADNWQTLGSAQVTVRGGLSSKAEIVGRSENVLIPDITAGFISRFAVVYEPSPPFDMIDFARFAQYWQTEADFNTTRDFSGNEAIDMADLADFANGWLTP